MNKPKPLCPICIGDYWNIAESFAVCHLHQEWFVTICKDCKKPVFSDCRGTCPKCSRVSSEFVGSNKVKMR